jgi:hypothetical protein
VREQPRNVAASEIGSVVTSASVCTGHLLPARPALIDAVYFGAPGPLYYRDHAAAGVVPHRAAELLRMIGEHHDHLVDITSTFGRKVEPVGAHASQWGKDPELDAFLRQRARRLGEAR